MGYPAEPPRPLESLSIEEKVDAIIQYLAELEVNLDALIPKIAEMDKQMVRKKDIPRWARHQRL